MPDRDAPARVSAESQRRWHFDKTINISTVTAILSCAALLASYIVKQDARLTTLEVRLDGQVATSAQVSKDMKEAARDLQGEIRQLRLEMMQFMRSREGGK